MLTTDTSVSLSSLLCQEDESCLSEYQDKDLNLDSCSISESDDEYIDMLIQREAAVEPDTHFSSVNSAACGERSWLKCARLDAIKWILNTRAVFGFHFRTAYLSLTYFDRFFSRRFIDNRKLWAIRLLSVACLSLAAKMEECKVPALSEYHVDEHNFESCVIQRMELLVLNTLDWKMGSVTPFAYLHYFITKFCGDSIRKELASRAIELILLISKEITLIEHRPSVIAAAAVLAAYDDRLTRTVELKMSLISSWGSLEKEQLICCYNLLLELDNGKSTPPRSLISPKMLPNHSSSADVLEISSISTALYFKRRLTYNESDQTSLSNKIQRQQ